MTIVDLSWDDFDSEVARSPLALVFFWTPWCKPCRRFGPTFQNSALDHPRVVHATVNTDVEQDLISKLRVFAVPTMMAFCDGAVVYNEPGILPASQLDELVTGLEELHLPAVRATMAAHDTANA